MRSSRIATIVLVTATMALFGCNSEKAPVCGTDDDCPIGSVCKDGSCEVLECTEEYVPVCGADGKTYGNACEARKAHVEVASQGECPQACGGIGGVTCPKGMFCEIPAGLCDVADAEGMCAEIPAVCPEGTEVYDPVCGCDGQTYSSDCHRQMAEVSKSHDGECEK